MTISDSAVEDEWGRKVQRAAHCQYAGPTLSIKAGASIMGGASIMSGGLNQTRRADPYEGRGAPLLGRRGLLRVCAPSSGR